MSAVSPAKRVHTPSDTIEVTALLLLTILSGIASSSLPRRLALADLLLGGATFLLVQGLVRDVGRLRRERREAAIAPSVPLRCMCVESTLGLSAIVAGSVLLFAWTPIVLHVGRVAWPMGVAALGAFGFLTKDVVFDARTRRIRRDVSHGRAG